MLIASGLVNKNSNLSGIKCKFISICEYPPNIPTTVNPQDKQFFKNHIDKNKIGKLKNSISLLLICALQLIFNQYAINGINAKNRYYN